MTDIATAPSVKIWKVTSKMFQISDTDCDKNFESSPDTHPGAKSLAEKEIVLRNDSINDVGYSNTVTNWVNGMGVTEFIHCPSLQLTVTYTTWVAATDVNQATDVGLQRIADYHAVNWIPCSALN